MAKVRAPLTDFFGQAFDTVVKDDIGVEAQYIQNHRAVRCDIIVDQLRHRVDQF